MKQTSFLARSSSSSNDSFADCLSPGAGWSGSLPVPELRHHPASPSLVDLVLPHLAGFTPVGLAQLEAVQLMNRSDAKFILSIAELEAVLQTVIDSGSYFVMEELGTRIFNYRNHYFDTRDYRMYHDHHNRKPDRYKVRIREYSEFSRVYAEVKRKYKEQTRKERIKLTDSGSIDDFAAMETLPGKARAFLDARLPFPTETLARALSNDFYRFTLIHRAMDERITIDLMIRFLMPDGRSLQLPHIAVAEIKYEAGLESRPFRNALRSLGIRPGGMSKYCLGTALLLPRIKYNNFKPTALQLVRERSSYAAV